VSQRSASVPGANGVATRPSALGAVAAALLASIIAGLTGLVLVFGSSLTEAPADAFIIAGLIYAIVPAFPALLAIDRLSGRWRPGKTRNLVIFVALSAIVAVVWFVPFLGLFVPTDHEAALAAVGEMALYHALSGAAGGLAFWLLTRR
jgi:hypothetical protein